MKQIFLFITVFVIATSACKNANSKDAIKSENKTEENASGVSTVEKGQEGVVTHLTKAQFLEKVMNYEKNPKKWEFLGDKPCIIDFYADWCGPCKIAAPILEEIAQEYKGKINVYKINTDKEPELSAAFGIRSIPAFLFCPQKENPQMSNGIGRTKEETKAMFTKMIDEFLLKK